MPTNEMYPVRISKRTRFEIKRTATEVILSQAETVRQALDLGLPLVKKKFGRKKK